jgi:hypothetical protein
MAIFTYSLYLVISFAITIWVGRTAFHHGRAFILDATRGNVDLTDSINNLLLVGFYLVNFGYVTLALRFGVLPATNAEVVEYLATKIGLVLVILGIMHFINLVALSSLRRRSLRRPEYVTAEAVPHASTDFNTLKTAASTSFPSS